MSRKRAFRVANGTFMSVVSDFLRSDKFLGLSPVTQQNYRYLLVMAGSQENLGAIRVESLRPSMVQGFLDTLADQPYTQRNAKSVLRVVERWAIVRDRLPHHITTGTEAPGGQGGHHPWSEAQVTLAEREASPTLSKFITLASNTGQRGSDLVKMRWSDIEEVDGYPGINVTQYKTALRLWVPFTDEMVKALATWERRLPFLIMKSNGEPFNRNQLTHRWNYERDTRPALESLRDPPLRIHGLRATAVVRLRRLGASIPLICDTIGMSPQMVKRYSRFSEQRENAKAAMRLLNARRT